MPPAGYLTLVLHAHLPYIRHPEYPDFLEEDWFFEAVTESYAPLLMAFERLRTDRIPYRITFSLSPTLASMLTDDLLNERLASYIDKRIDLLAREMQRHGEDAVGKLARRYHGEYQDVRRFVFDRCRGDLISALRDLEASGHIEVITCPATHGLFPLMSAASSVRAQVKTARRLHERLLKKPPHGIWLAECGYQDGVDAILAEAGIRYFFIDAHGIVLGEPRPAFGVYAPVITEEGVAVFARDDESSKQVWSRKEGYPGDPAYREFYRDIGFDADFDYIRPYLHADEVRRGVGIKYHRITGDVDLGRKELYQPEAATERVRAHAVDFVESRIRQAERLAPKMPQPPVMVAPYDTELFGHWWYEGPQFLERVIREVAARPDGVELITCSDYLSRHPTRQLQKPNPSTWGAEGYNMVWLNGANSWIYRHQYWAEERMELLARRHVDAEGDLRRALNQLLRELLLLQSSDWAFIMTTGTAVTYATRRFRQHMERFFRLSNQIDEGAVDPAFLHTLEEQDGLFPDIDFRDLFPANGDGSAVLQKGEKNA